MTTQMARETAEQPESLQHTIEALLDTPETLDALGALFTGRRRVLFAARGTSDNAAVYGRYLLETQAGVLGGLASPSVATHYRADLDLRDTVLVSVSQSGRTEEIVETQRWGRGRGAATVAITNGADSPLAQEADVALVTQAGDELAVPATKSYTAQLVGMVLLSVAALRQDGDVAAAAALEDQLRRAPAQAARILQARAGVDPAVETLGSHATTVVTGRGLLMGTALETALKIEETCLRPVRGYSYADLRHGPIAAVGEGVAAVVHAAADGPLSTPMVQLAQDLADRGATVIGVGGSAEFQRAVGVHVPGAELPETLAPLVNIIPMQLVVEQLSRSLGLSPDAPQGLAKVTRTDA
ncbi:SIS domain-containing protein [Nesterenkonia xinjiangensis]|uniref:Glucosamine--fructose-6-phosphate aminotransferase (Isomerizing) n=1 Tax=Nesterenkonia xinjiangensis TaxID=225327 RepID=A0A7Z0GML2_9MICC|nr:SIS domain-containing protein [Nesterenkonia xinjiangensis]NYJ78279.1 glucosamine--fructose-6-phosphate aminotransferase (isomerizing) [Nesterenkonia xinjiangensis]